MSEPRVAEPGGGSGDGLRFECLDCGRTRVGASLTARLMGRGIRGWLDRVRHGCPHLNQRAVPVTPSASGPSA